MSWIFYAIITNDFFFFAMNFIKNKTIPTKASVAIKT